MNKNMIRPFIIIAILITFLADAKPAKESKKVTYPDPSRWTEKVKEYEKWDTQNTYPKDAVLFVGSSSIVLWKTADAFTDLPVINRGFGGSYMADALFYVNQLILKYKPKVIVIYEGDNDIAGSIPPEWVHKDFVNLANKIHNALPQTEIICLAAKLCDLRWNWREEINEVNRLNSAYAKTKKYITFVDTASVLLRDNKKPNPDFFRQDQLHLSDIGYAKWNTLLAPIILEKYLSPKESENEQ